MKRFLPFLLILFFVQPAGAVVKTWTGVNTNWNDPANWSPSGIPVKNDSVYINDGALHYPLLKKDLTIYQYTNGGADTSFYTCMYLYLGPNARIDGEEAVRHTITFSTDADIHGTINLHGSIWCEQDWEVLRTYHTNFIGAHLVDVNLNAGVTICGFNFPIDSYVNCYIEGGISVQSAPFSNCILVGSVGFDPYNPPYLSGGSIRLKKKYGGRISMTNYQSCSYPPVNYPNIAWVDIVNDSNEDDTIYVYSNSLGINAYNLNGLIRFNTTNECGRLYIGAVALPSSFPNTNCPYRYGYRDSTIINANITIQNKGIVEFRGPVLLQGVMTANGGHFIKTYPCAVNTFPPGDTINCPLDLRQARIDLAPGKLVVNNALSADSILHADTAHYLVTTANGSYASRAKQSLGNVLFPVGTAASYTPLFIADANATGNVYSARVSQGVFDQGYSGNLLTAKVVDRTWHVSKLTNTGSSATLTLQWNSADELPNFFHDYCSISHYSNNAWHAGPGGLATGTGPFQQTLANQTSFSPFAVGSGGILPLGCVSFTGVQKDKGIELSWTTGSGTGHYHFLVQRSTDGISFTDIANIDAGIISQPRNFYYTDTRFRNGDNYYRVFEVDATGNKIQLCSILRVKGSVVLPFVLLLQNPVPQQLPLQFNLDADQELIIGIYDVTGRRLISTQTFMKKGVSTFSLGMQNLPRGQYLLKATGVSEIQTILFTH